MANNTEAAAPLIHKKTFCRICVSFCGLDVITDGRKVIRILPDKTHPYSWRDFCLKGASAGAMLEHPKRLRTPMKRVGDKYVAVSYAQAIKEIAAQLNDIRGKHGANAIATYIGNPGLSNSPSAAFQGGFTKALGTSSVYHVGSVDQNSFHVVAQEMYGSEMTVLIPDVDHAECMLFIGMNPAVSQMAWLDAVPDGWKRILAAQAKGADLIVVDPRQTPTTQKANTHIVIRPGEDWAFLLGLIKVIFEQGWQHRQDCDEALGCDSLQTIAEQNSLEKLAARCNVPIDTIRDVARRFATANTAVCVARTGVSQHRNGTLGEWLSHALNLITGRIDRKGGRYYVPGILKNSMKVYNKMAPQTARRSRIGGYRAVAGGYPLAILPDEITTPGTDQVRALIINAGNPVVSGADGTRLDAALQELDLLIAIDLFQRESHRHAHWLIPGCHFLEREEFLAMMFYELPFAQLGPAVIEPPPGVKPEWQFFRDLAVEMNIPFMGMRGLNTVIRLSRWLAGLTGNPHHAFNPRWLWTLTLKSFSDFKFKDLAANPQGVVCGEKSYGHFRALLQTPDKRIHAAPEALVEILKQRLAEPLSTPHQDYPLQLVNQRRLSMMNSWLVETVKQAKVFGDYVDINPADASRYQIQDDQSILLTSRTGQIKARARITEEVPPGIVSMDHGWGSRLFDPQGGAEPEVKGVMRNLLVSAGEIDELAGTPNLNGTYINLQAAA